MSRWFRLDDDIINDPKILLLPEAMRWVWIAFLCIASKNGGMLPAIEVVALSLRVKATKAAEYLTRLVSAGLIDRTETGFTPHNWNGRQFKTDPADPTNATRQKNFRAKHRDELRQLKALRDTTHNALRNGQRNGVTDVTVKRPESEKKITTSTFSVERAEARQGNVASPELMAILAK